MKFFFKTFLLLFVIAFIVIQFFGINKTAPESPSESDFITIYSPPAEVETILKSACYDCHSYETTYPWYSNVQPVGWWMEEHVEHARHHINFSLWADYSHEDKTDKLEELAEEVEEEKMPLPSYIWGHAEARLTDQERELLINWAENLQTSLEEQTPDSLTASETIN